MWFIEEIKWNELISKNHKKVYKILNYTDNLLTLTSTITLCVSIFSFASLLGIPIGISSSVAKTKIWAITAGIQKYKSIIRGKKDTW